MPVSAGTAVMMNKGRALCVCPGFKPTFSKEQGFKNATFSQTGESANLFLAIDKEAI